MHSGIPLAERIRPKKINEIIGQQHLIGEHGAIKNALKNNIIPSIIFGVLLV